MIDFPCNSCISRKEGFVSCDSRYDCYQYRKWDEEISNQLEKEYGILEKVITPWEELQKRARIFNQARFRETMSEKYSIPLNTVEILFSLLDGDEKLIEEVLRTSITLEEGPIEYVIKFMSLREGEERSRDKGSDAFEKETSKVEV